MALRDNSDMSASQPRDEPQDDVDTFVHDNVYKPY